MAQRSGWSSTQNAAALPIVDAFARNLLMKYGGRDDDIWAFHNMAGYKSDIQGANFTGGQGTDFGTTGRVALRDMGGSGTPSNPGAHNWETLARNVGRASTGVKEVAKTGINLALDRIQGVNPASMARADFRTHMDNRFKTTTYSNVMRMSRNQYRTEKKAEENRQAQAAAAEADQLQTAMNTYANTFDPSMSYESAYAAGAKTVSKTKSKTKKASRSPSATKPKANRPTPSTPVNLNDPSNW